jgi:hypothetical protein
MTSPTPITPKEFRARGYAALGGYGWIMRLARGLGVSGQSVHRWLNGAVPVPEYAVAAIELIEWLKAAKSPIPARFNRD